MVLLRFACLSGRQARNDGQWSVMNHNCIYLSNIPRSLVTMMCFRISMSKVFTGRRDIPDQLFQFFYFREASIILSIEYFFVSNCDMEVAIDLAWLQGHCFQIVSKSS